MRLHRLTVAAFGPFRTTQTVDFDALSSAGLFLLHGPTGAGKTAVLDAVCFALYGKVPGSREKFTGTLRSDHADPHTRTEVVLDFTVAGRHLEITRRPEQPRPKLRGQGLTTEKPYSTLREHRPERAEWQPLSRSHQEIGEEIKTLLGMSREQFCQVVLLPQGQFARFLRADAEARADLLGTLFDTGRFAAAEARLAELRRAAAEQVRQGDAALLALAHRLTQAAGDCADLRESPLPELIPGDPGLAEAVLRQAALARTGARERLDAAAAAVVAAESAHRIAQRHAEAVRSLADRRRRHDDARRRADALEAERAETDRMRARLEQARAADAVTPALALRDTAEREHRAATDAERRARERLPRNCAGLGAAHLTELERAHRAELGGLAAARHAEQRAAALDTRLAALAGGARADDELLQETDDWLDGWEAERARLQQAADSAQEAVARAEHLAGLLTPALRRKEAGERRDRLAAGLRTAEERLRGAERTAGTARGDWLDLRERRLDGMAAELAARLADGDPCPVCGATAHPRPASPGAGHIDRAAEEAALAVHRRAEAARDAARTEAEALRRDLAAATAEAGDTPLAELAAEAARLTAEHTEARSAASEVRPAREALERAEREHLDRLAQRREAGERAAARTSERETLLAERAALRQQLTRARGDAADLTARTAELERHTALLAEAIECTRAAEATAGRLKEADGRAADAAYRAGFDTPQAAADAALDPAGQRALQQRLDQWQAEWAAATAELADPRLAEAAAQPPAAPQAAEAAADAAGRRWRDASAAEAAARARCTELDRLSAAAAADARRLAPLHRRHGLVARLAALTAGTSAENERRMRLESYVLAARLEQVAAAAGARLARMSSGRYTLVHSDRKTGGRGRHGLGLHVVDAWTGRERDTATLSGGETFFASLALALGLADVVAEEAGGVALDTLFIDEGFGTLDEQTLDEVLDVLDSLRERDRSVGIVSHVPDLRRRIPARLEIRKAPDGSTVRLHRAPLDG